MAATHGLAAILRDTRKSALLRMRSEKYSPTHSRVMTAEPDFQTAKNIPRRGAPGVLHENCPSRNEGAGNTGCTLHPRSRVQNCTKKRTRAYRFSGGNPAFPAQWFYGLYVLSPAIGLSCHRHLAELPPQDLTPASRRQDHTTLPSACEALSSEALPAAIASHPAYATIMIRPSSGVRRRII
jgi:hypothetical protein